MDINEAYNNIRLVREKLIAMQKITSFVIDIVDKTDDNGSLILASVENMGTADPKKSEQLNEIWVQAQKILPPGFSIDSNLIRHLSFNQASDWLDIAKRDIPRELENIEEYKKRLALIEYLDGLHPEIKRVVDTILNNDIDAALKTVFSTLDTKIRLLIKAKPGESTVPQIGKAFKDKTLNATHELYTDSIRNFLQGVLGFYRSIILHNPLPSRRNSIKASLSLFCLAHEAFVLLDSCSKKTE